MFVFTASSDIGESLWQLVQCWIVAERLGRKLFVKWPGLPAELRLAACYDANRHSMTNAQPYKEGLYRTQTNEHLVLYYYRRIFTQILLCKSPPARALRICFCGEESFAYEERVRHHYRYNQKEVYRLDKLAADSWANFLLMRDCDVLVGRRTLFFDAAFKTVVRRRERWVLTDDRVLYEK